MLAASVSPLFCKTNTCWCFTGGDACPEFEHVHPQLKLLQFNKEMKAFELFHQISCCVFVGSWLQIEACQASFGVETKINVTSCMCMLKCFIYLFFCFKLIWSFSFWILHRLIPWCWLARCRAGYQLKVCVNSSSVLLWALHILGFERF